jgi:hypothetical protein
MSRDTNGNRRLVLHRLTLRTLSREALGHIVGGARQICDLSGSCKNVSSPPVPPDESPPDDRCNAPTP